MRWPRGKTPPPTPRKPVCEGAKAHRDATASLAEATSHWPEVKRVSQSLRELRERNHFGDQLTLIFKGGENADG